MALVESTDQARRDFETHPVALAAVADGLSVERYRKLLLELYQIVWHFNPSAQRRPAVPRTRIGSAYSCTGTWRRSPAMSWVGNDLEAIGVGEAALLAHRPSPSTLALIGYNYWGADRRDPCSVLGMMYVLEVIASVYGGAFASAMRESLLLIGDRGVTFIGSHATLDADHMVQLRKILVTIEDAGAREAIIESTLVNFEFVTRIFAAI